MKNELIALKEDFDSGRCPKPDYIEKMHRYHSLLSQYSELISKTDLLSIEIDGNGITVVTRRGGIKLAWDVKDHRAIPAEICNFSEYESGELDLICRLIDINFSNNFHALDVGANIGWYAVNLGRRYSRAHIDAFEPIPDTYRWLEKNLSINQCANVHPHLVALSDRIGSTEFYHRPTMSVSSSMENLTPASDTVTIVCNTTTIDETTKSELVPVSFIKCDVEGSEFMVLRGAEITLEKDRPIVFCELLRKWSARFDYHPNDVLQFMGQHGYQAFAVWSNHAHPIQNVTDDTEETNFLFLIPSLHKV